MGSIWKAVTSFFKAKEERMAKEEKRAKDEEKTTATVQNEDDEDDDDDTDDEDFVPNQEKEEAVSEELSDDADEDDQGTPKTGKKKARGKKRKLSKKGAVNGKRRKTDSDSEDSENDEDFVLDNSKSLNDSETASNQLTPEDLAAQEAEEKAETDRLWADFLSSVEEEKAKKKNKERTVEKIVNKVYDFAGEKVSVQEKVKVTVSNSSESDKSKNGELARLKSTPCSNHIDDGAVPGPSSAMKMNGSSSNSSTPSSSTSSTPTNQNQQRPRPRRGGISILGNDPETIGLDELDKRGLSGLLKAFQTKSKRIGTLEKSKLDWESFKRQKGLVDELQHHNKSRDTYIDKQEFLQRADHRQFELEKSMRATQRSKRLAN